jgi:hypothetical protein
MSRHLPRRAFLRGLFGGSAVAVGLPALHLTAPPAWATTGAGPDRFGVWFWGNGTKPDTWQPTGTGTGFVPSAQLAPLAGVQDYVSVATGYEIKTATHPHHSGMTGILTGEHYHQLGTTRDTIVSTFARQSVDQDAADHFAGQTPFRSLEVGITRFRGTDEGSTFQHLSHNGPNLPNPSEYDASSLYQRLFGMPLNPDLDLARMSVLDVVSDQTQRLSRQLGAADKLRLEQHLESIRALEQRLAAGPTGCVPGTDPGTVVDRAEGEDIERQNQVMSELLVLALACDLTRSFSVQFSTCGSGVVVWQVGATDGLHLTCHTEAAPQPIVEAATTFTMEQLAGFLQLLRDTPEGSGNLLERCSILCTSELSDGLLHRNDEFPLIVAGKGNGRLVGGVHHRSTTADNASKVVLTALRGAGVPAASWGVDEGYVTESVSELEA